MSQLDLTSISRTSARLQRGALSVLTVLAAISFVGAPASADTFLVDTTTDAVDLSPGDGDCDDGRGNCTLRAAVMESNALAGADTILLEEDVYLLELLVCGGEIGQSQAATFDDSCGDLDITSEVTVRGVGAYRTFVDAETMAGGSSEFNSGHFHVSSSGVLRLEDLMLRGAAQKGEGGAIDNDGGTVFVTRSVLYDNSASLRGGAIATSDGVLTVRDSYLLLNRAATATDGGGGIFHSNSSTPTVDTLVIIDSTIAYSEAQRDDIANAEGNGGGITVGTNGRARLEQVTLVENQARGLGGGIWVTGSASLVTILGSTIALNKADSDLDFPTNQNGGGIYHAGASASTVQIVNTIIAENEGSGMNIDPMSVDCFGPVQLNYGLVGDSQGCAITGANNQTGSTFTPLDVQFLPFGDRGGPVPTMGFASTSPARDAADGTQCSALDARGMARVQDAGCDLGPWESGNPMRFQPKVSLDAADSAEGDGTCGTPFLPLGLMRVCTLRAAVQEGVAAADSSQVETTIELGAFDFNVGGEVGGDDSEDDGEIGDLDVFDQALISIEGQGARGTRIVGTGFDRLFHVFDSASLTLRDLALVGGAAPGSSSGGNLLATGTSSATLEQALVTDGSAANGGGLAAFSSATLQVVRSTIEGNEARTKGGGVYATGQMLEMENSTVHNNDADRDGGGIAIQSGAYDLDYLTVTGNDADADRSGDDGDGGGIFFAQSETGSVRASVIALNRDATGGLSPGAPDCSGVTVSAGTNLVGEHTSCGFGAIGDLLGTTGAPLDPMLGPFQDNGGPTDTRVPLTGSPLLDVGPSTSLPATDQRGLSRLADGDGLNGAQSDIGATELGEVSIFADSFESGDTLAWN